MASDGPYPTDVRAETVKLYKVKGLRENTKVDVVCRMVDCNARPVLASVTVKL